MVHHLLDHLRSLSPKARSRIPGLSPERADIIVAGVAIVDAVMQRLKVNTLRVHDRGIRDGLILGMVRELHPARTSGQARPPDRMTAVRQFAKSCNYEQAHSEHVAGLALQVFDQLATQIPEGHSKEPWRTPFGRELLEAAGVLHDVGYRINYAKHHKHSYHMIVHSDLPGFTHREIELIANIARYHRRANPKNSHRAFARLPESDQELVRRLAAILRIVDGLDRAHAQVVRSVRVETCRSVVNFLVHADAEPAVDMWGADRKSGLFEKVFELKPKFEWTGAAVPTATIG
jgi:exopolyphosphatase/guanosine-5'-triphosphate,3'-diphosphate pyrophosphatase